MDRRKTTRFSHAYEPDAIKANRFVRHRARRQSRARRNRAWSWAFRNCTRNFAPFAQAALAAAVLWLSVGVLIAAFGTPVP